MSTFISDLAAEMSRRDGEENMLHSVLVVTLPRSRGPRDLVAWYEAAILQSLHDQPTTLTIFTAQEVARRFTSASDAYHGAQGEDNSDARFKASGRYECSLPAGNARRDMVSQ